jgi:hypothetical protein
MGFAARCTESRTFAAQNLTTVENDREKITPFSPPRDVWALGFHSFRRTNVSIFANAACLRSNVWPSARTRRARFTRATRITNSHNYTRRSRICPHCEATREKLKRSSRHRGWSRLPLSGPNHLHYAARRIAPQASPTDFAPSEVA